MSHRATEYMRMAIATARANRVRGGHAIAAVVVRGDRVIGQAATSLRWEFDPTAHAEVNAIRAACQFIKSRYLEDSILYSTFEPCPMCVAAAVWAKMTGIVFGALMSDQTENAKQRIAIPALFIAERGEPRLDIRAGFLRDECLELLALDEPRHLTSNS